MKKPKEGKKALGRLIAYFKPEMKYVLFLALTVILGVIANVIAPSMQSTAIDNVVTGKFGEIPRILSLMLMICGCAHKAPAEEKTGTDHERAQITKDFISLLDEDPELKDLVEESIELAAVNIRANLHAANT